jgi:peptidoglycan/xylan/chitin deacetylase (PgdA/CDA1 family)
MRTIPKREWRSFFISGCCLLILAFILNFSLATDLLAGSECPITSKKDMARPPLRPVRFDTGMVSIMFDDGFISVYTKAFPIMAKYGIRGNVAVIPGLVGKTDYMTWDQIETLAQNGWTIMSHSVNHRKMMKLTAQELDYELGEARRILEERGYGGAKYFVYPRHEHNNLTFAKVRQYYEVARGCNDAEMGEQFPLQDPIDLCCYNGDMAMKKKDKIMTMTHLENYWLQAVHAWDWAITYFHDIDNYEANFESLMRFLSDHHIQVRTWEEITPEKMTEQELLRMVAQSTRHSARPIMKSKNAPVKKNLGKQGLSVSTLPSAKKSSPSGVK